MPHAGDAFVAAPVSAVEPPASTRQRSLSLGVPLGAAAIGAVLLIATGGFATGSGGPAAAIARPALAATPSAPAAERELSLGDERGAEDDDGRDEDSSLVPFDVDGVLERFPSLQDWVHPVSGAPVVVPRKSSRKFGAAREGERPAECGSGHCGVDLGGEVGTPIFAVAWGEVVRIERRADRRSGRYVKLRHPEGEETAYMHLDEIAADLRLGDEVEAGQVIGTLGRTGIHEALPHLHFGLAVPTEGRRDESMTFIDPVPFLREAAVVRD